MPDLATLTIYPATPEQIKISRVRNFAEWGKGFTLEDYLAANTRLDSIEHALDGKMVTWVLAPRTDPRTPDFLCACETFKRSGLMKRPNEPVHTVTSYGVASVFTPAENRSKGYARHMMRLLHWAIGGQHLAKWVPIPAEWGSPPATIDDGQGVFSALWSDIGKDFYNLSSPALNQDGWVYRDSFATIWKVPPRSSDSDAPEKAQEWQLVSEGDLQDIWKQDAELIVQELDNASTRYPRKTLLSFLPDAGVAAFQYQRAIAIGYPNLLNKPLDSWGLVSVQDSTDLAFATWTIEVKPPQPKNLLITRLRCSPSQLPSLLSRTIKLAQDHGLEQIEVWNLPKELEEVAVRLGGVTEERPEHLSCLAVYDGDARDIKWLLNEK